MAWVAPELGSCQCMEYYSVGYNVGFPVPRMVFKISHDNTHGATLGPIEYLKAFLCNYLHRARVTETYE